MMNAIMRVVAVGLLALSPVGAMADAGGCPGDLNDDNQVTVDELVTAIGNALNGCPPPPTVTPGPGERYVDNGDGTVSDSETGLIWEKKSNDRGVHDVDNTYTWTAGPGFGEDGTLFTSFLAELNGEPCFAGHCDWRLPTVAELATLVDFSRWAPAVDPAFDTGCENNCDIETCSCTNLDYYWSATSSAELPDYAWSADGNQGFVSLFQKTLEFSARAVRGGGS